MTPAERLRHHLTAARERGEPFDTAWANAMKARVVPYNNSRSLWLSAFESSREEWHAAYERRPKVIAATIAHIEAALDEGVHGMIVGEVAA
jgi:formyltetrahydrofolate hydrolase